jgi:hypothetical protein
MSARYLSDVAGATAQHCWETLADGNLGKHFSGEHRLPACPSRQLAEMHLSMYDTHSAGSNRLLPVALRQVFR